MYAAGSTGAYRPGSSALEACKHVIRQGRVEVVADDDAPSIDAEGALRPLAGHRNEAGNRLAGFCDHHFLTGGDFREQTGQMCLGLVDVHSLHEVNLDWTKTLVKMTSRRGVTRLPQLRAAASTVRFPPL